MTTGTSLFDWQDGSMSPLTQASAVQLLEAYALAFGEQTVIRWNKFGPIHTQLAPVAIDSVVVGLLRDWLGLEVADGRLPEREVMRRDWGYERSRDGFRHRIAAEFERRRDRDSLVLLESLHKIRLPDRNDPIVGPDWFVLPWRSFLPIDRTAYTWAQWRCVVFVLVSGARVMFGHLGHRYFENDQLPGALAKIAAKWDFHGFDRAFVSIAEGLPAADRGWQDCTRYFGFEERTHVRPKTLAVTSNYRVELPRGRVDIYRQDVDYDRSLVEPLRHGAHICGPGDWSLVAQLARSGEAA